MVGVKVEDGCVKGPRKVSLRKELLSKDLKEIRGASGTSWGKSSPDRQGSGFGNAKERKGCQ